MKDINSYICQGRVVKDADYRDIDNGKGWINFTIAVNTSHKKAGVWSDKGNFFMVKNYGTKKVAQNLLKGRRVVIQGNLEQDRWQDNEGGNKSKILINAVQISIEFKDVIKTTGDTVTINDDDISF